MKNQVKKFSQYIKESDQFERPRSVSSPENIRLIDLFECYAEAKFGRGTVLIAADLSNPARDLASGGINIIQNPSQEDIDEAMERDFEWGLFEDGRMVDSYYGGR